MGIEHVEVRVGDALELPVESGTVDVCEWTNYALAVRLQAAAMGLPFLPARTMLGTDTFRKSAAKVIECPFTGEQLLALPALSPDQQMAAMRS